MYKNENVVLNNGLSMPKMVFGTWRMWERLDNGEKPVLCAIINGCRAIDTAQAYNTEIGVRNAINKCGIDRSSLFISTKLDPDTVYDRTSADLEFDKSLANLGLDYIDMMYIHAPSSWDRSIKHDNVAIYEVLQQKIAEGKLKSIGLSNFSVQELYDLLSKVKAVPQAIQIQLSVGCENQELVEFCKNNNITIIPYSPLASGYLLRNQHFIDKAHKIGLPPSMVAIDYVTQKYGACIFGSENPHHIEQILKLSPTLKDVEMQELGALSEKIGDQNMWSYQGDWVKEPLITSAEL